MTLITEWIGEGKRGVDNPDLHGIRRQHLDHIEAKGDVGHLKQAKPVHGSPSDELLFLLIDGIERAPHLFASAGLYLGKDERFFVSADKIDLPTTRCPEIPTEDLPSLPFEMTGGQLLAPAAKGKMVRTRRWAGRPAQNRVDDAGKVHVRGA